MKVLWKVPNVYGKISLLDLLQLKKMLSNPTIINMNALLIRNLFLNSKNKKEIGGGKKLEKN
jgi:hypothetical protein